MSRPVDFFMNILKLLFALSLLALAGFAASGCQTMDEPNDTAVPWSRPQAWEQKQPGMGM
jgi:hypothetical protein